jgi:1,4-dihydroxy-2-naphthoate octaprenyltransferase
MKMATSTGAKPQTRAKHPLPLVKRWQVSLDTCNCPDVHNADFLSRWLVIARACVFSMTFMSGFIGVLLALGTGAFVENPLYSSWLAFLCVIGLLAAHASNNLVNDWTDVRKGVDTEDYPRAQYSTHPILGGLTTPEHLLLGAFILTALDGLIMLYLAAVTGPLVIVFSVAGLALSLGYTAFLKRYALGELTAMLVWGPLMTGGTAYAISGQLTWDMLLLTLPYGLIVASVLIGKHTDKIENDRPVGVHSIPVLIGIKRALILNKITFVVFYVLIAGLVLFRVTDGWVLLALLAIPNLRATWKIYSLPKPASKPDALKLIKDMTGEQADDWPVWPLWYVAWAMHFNREAGKWFIAGLMLNLIVPEVIKLLG